MQLLGDDTVLEVNRDVTEMKRLSTALEESEKGLGSLAAIVESSDDAIVSKSLDGIIASWNRGAERIFGYTAKEAIGQPITIVIPADRHSEEVCVREDRVDVIAELEDPDRVIGIGHSNNFIVVGTQRMTDVQAK